MRRPPIVLVAMGLLTWGAGPAAGALSIDANEVLMLRAAGSEAEPAFAARVGAIYRFEVAYSVAGAKKIGTGHLFAFENAITGERLEVRSKSFRPEPPGPYRESSELRIPESWAPGVYRLRWTLNARNPRLASARATGTRVFLVVG